MLKKRCLCARVLAICPDGRIVVIQKPDGHIEFPGGGMISEDLGDPELTALRELCEETGIMICGSGRLSVVLKQQKDAHHQWICYRINLSDEELRWYRPGSLEGMVRIICPKLLISDLGRFMTHRQTNILNKHIATLAIAA